MSRDRRGDGVQVVAGSNAACPTKQNPSSFCPLSSTLLFSLHAYAIMHMIWLEMERI